jgi:NADP-dependent 3-hydroxy acid dehydrogenase YdfG
MLRAGQCALVTGAGSGIGRAIAVGLARAGLRVWLVGRTAPRLHETAAIAGGEVLVADIAAEEQRAAVAQVVGPALDVLVHSAGVYLRRPVGDLSAADWQRVDAVNVHAPILLTTACLTALRAAPGQVVFINSSAALLAAGPGMAAYAGSKVALRAAADALRQEVNASGVRVVSVFPGRTDTPMQTAILAAEGRTAPPGALLRPEDVAEMVLAALRLPDTAEVTEIVMRPMRKL